MPRVFPVLFTALAAVAVAVATPAADDGFVPLFTGTDLTGWVNVNCAPGTFFVKNNEIVTTGRPTGFLRTAKPYENFELEMEWMHENKTAVGNSGLFVWGDPLPAVGTGYTRGIEVQVLVNYKADWATNHGDIFSIWGAKCTPDRPHPTQPGLERCLPSENRAKGGGEWNHYRVIGTDGVLKLHVNGKEVSGVSKASPRKGYLALESEGAVCHFRNLKIKELPSTNPKPGEIADLDAGHVSQFTGLDLTGWKTEAGAWKASDGVLRAAGTAPIASEKTFGPCELLFDWKVPAKSAGKLVVDLGGEPKTTEFEAHAGDWKRATLTATKPGPVVFHPVPGLEIRSIFVREIPGKSP
ncbi:MAG: family 16 glycoside hydrolase [Fimbriiglobus sp.]